jgi:hypothetical protein
MDENHTAETETMLLRKGHWPSVGSLSAREFSNFPDRDCEDRAVWLEIICPDHRCFSEEEPINLVDLCESTREKKDLWLEVFCPESSCEIIEASQLP